MLEKIFMSLKGAWTIDRLITPGGVMRGEAVFTPLSDTEYAYEEQGVLTLDHGGVIEDVKRLYSYQLNEGQIQVFYADGPDKGTLFQTLEFTSDSHAAAAHLCGDDLYQSSYNFDLPQGFEVTHTVSGPKKDYVSVTKFKR